MKLKYRLQRMIIMCLLLAGIVNLSGCLATNKVLDLRKERETQTKEAINFWSLAAVRSAHVMPDGEVFACVEFRDSPADEPQVYTINLSRTPQVGKTYADFMPAGSVRTEQPRAEGEQAELACYLYPLQWAQKGCVDATNESPSPVSALKIENIQAHRDDQSRLPGILLSPDGRADNEWRIFEVSFAPEGSEARTSGAKDALLLYLPPATIEEQVQAIGIAGAFEPGSEWVNPYSLLVVPAVAGDVVIDTAIVLFGVAAFGGWACGR